VEKRRRKEALLGQKGLKRTKVVTSYPRVADHYRMWSSAAATTTHGTPYFLRQLVCVPPVVNFLQSFACRTGRTFLPAANEKRRAIFPRGNGPEKGLGSRAAAGLSGSRLHPMDTYPPGGHTGKGGKKKAARKGRP
jgi:hypothetical protein